MGLKTNKVGRYRRSKSDKPITKPIETTKTAEHWEEYLNTYSMQMEPATDAFFRRIAIELVKWAREDQEALIISEFSHIKGFHPRTLEKWSEKHPNIEHAYSLAMSLIADRRERMLLKGDLSSVKYMMPQYSDLWMKEDKRRAKQRKEEDEKKNFRIELPAFASSDIVPESKKDD